MAINEYALGQAVRLTETFTDPDTNLPVDPGTVLFKVKNPSTGTVTTYTYGTDVGVVRISTGVYRLKFTPAVSGTWWYAGQSQNDDAALEQHFYVKPTRL